MNSTSPERFMDKSFAPFQDNEIASLTNSAELRKKLLSTKEINEYEVTGNTLRQKEICQKFFEEKEQTPKHQEFNLDLISSFSSEKKNILDKRLSLDVSYLINGDPPCSPIRTLLSIDCKNKSNSSPLGRNCSIQTNEENSFWEKNFLLPNNHTEPLQYNFYALDLKSNTIFSHDQEFEANLNEDITLLSHLWSPQNSSPKMETKKLITLSPLKIRKEGSEMKIELGYKLPTRFERKQNTLVLYNNVSFISDYREITSEICIGTKK